MFASLLQVILGVSVAALAYAYVGYPLLLWLMSLWRARAVKAAPCEPLVSVIITAYNEERDLRGKLENTLTLDYPQDKLEVIVASDCSTDATDDIAREFAPQGVILHRQLAREGKTSAQNAAIAKARGEIVVFSDATTLYQSNVLRARLHAFPLR